jgi:hypothetical protein
MSTYPPEVKICEDCGRVCKPVRHKPDMGRDILLGALFPWLLNLFIDVIDVVRRPSCPFCKGKMVALTSPEGKAVLEKYDKEI